MSPYVRGEGQGERAGYGENEGTGGKKDDKFGEGGCSRARLKASRAKRGNPFFCLSPSLSQLKGSPIGFGGEPTLRLV